MSIIYDYLFFKNIKKQNDSKDHREPKSLLEFDFLLGILFINNVEIDSISLVEILENLTNYYR